MQLSSLIRRLYHALPLSPGMRFRVGKWRRDYLRRGVAQTVLAAASVAPEERQQELGALVEDGRDFFFFGVIDWHFRHQRPQQLALALARSGRRVYYISVNFAANDTPGYTLEHLHPGLHLYQVNLNMRGALNVYTMRAQGEQLVQLKLDVRDLMCNIGAKASVNVVQHPFWFDVAAFVPSARTVYDCMDHHAGFSNTAEAHSALELQLLAAADLTIVTSDFLADFAKNRSRRVELIRNAAEFEHFYAAKYLTGTGVKTKKLIGYYGAIAEWFDVELVIAIARRFPYCEIQLIGADSVDAGSHLRECANVVMYGEKPYAELPQWLAGFDVCLIPFRVNDLTLATNPVKVYEYLSAGKPVVSVDLPELRQFGDLIYRAGEHAKFLDEVDAALTEQTRQDAMELVERRIEFVRGQTWQHRTAKLLHAAEDTTDEPRVSVVVIAYNQWALTERCLHSLVTSSDYANLQIIVVDNASIDDTPKLLQAWGHEATTNRVVILNSENLGFAAAVNQGLNKADGDYLVILNNDTIVSPGWARGMRRHFEQDSSLGLICPITNNIGNEAQVALAGSKPPEVMASAKFYSLGKLGSTIPLSTAAFFCVMMPRLVWRKVGPLDEQFFPGFFEDDDYCRRVQQNDWKIGCAEDVFVFHELSASFDREGAVRKQAIFDRNKKLFEAKWGAWTPHVYRKESLPG